MSKATLDAIDGKILQYLVRNARMPFLEIARECGISGAAIHQRIRKLHDSGVILGSRLIVDPKMLGFDVCALIGICVQDPMYMMQTMEKLKEIPEIVECHFITGNFNIVVKLYCLDNEHLMKTIFDGILRIHRACIQRGIHPAGRRSAHRQAGQQPRQQAQRQRQAEDSFLHR